MQAIAPHNRTSASHRGDSKGRSPWRIFGSFLFARKEPGVGGAERPPRLWGASGQQALLFADTKPCKNLIDDCVGGALAGQLEQAVDGRIDADVDGVQRLPGLQGLQRLIHRAAGLLDAGALALVGDDACRRIQVGEVQQRT